jgi:hypothetical protein
MSSGLQAADYFMCVSKICIFEGVMAVFASFTILIAYSAHTAVGPLFRKLVQVWMNAEN